MGSGKLTIKDLHDLLEEVKDSVNAIKQQLSTLESNFSTVSKKVEAQEGKVSKLEDKLNEREQHSRNSSVRIFGLQLSQEVSKDAVKTSEVVYSKVLKPILELVVKEVTIFSVPGMLDVIEYSYCLPKTQNQDHAPIICRFHSCILRMLTFKHKREFLSKQSSKIYITEDLTAATGSCRT